MIPVHLWYNFQISVSNCCMRSFMYAYERVFLTFMFIDVQLVCSKVQFLIAYSIPTPRYTCMYCINTITCKMIAFLVNRNSIDYHFVNWNTHVQYRGIVSTYTNMMMIFSCVMRDWWQFFYINIFLTKNTHTFLLNNESW